MVQISNNNISSSTTTSFKHEFIAINNNNTNLYQFALLEKAKLARKISDGKNKIPHKFLGRKI